MMPDDQIETYVKDIDQEKQEEAARKKNRGGNSGQQSLS
jgi:20S proteasome subunit alpha 4